MILTSPDYNRPKSARRLGKRSVVFPCPNIQTSTTFMANRDDGFGTDDMNRKVHHARARAAGINPTGKTWSPQLNTWYESKDDVRRICEARGCACEGLVNVKATEVEVEEKPYRVADDLVETEVATIVSSEHDGKISPKKLTDLTEATRERLKGSMD